MIFRIAKRQQHLVTTISRRLWCCSRAAAVLVEMLCNGPPLSLTVRQGTRHGRADGRTNGLFVICSSSEHSRAALTSLASESTAITKSKYSNSGSSTPAAFVMAYAYGMAYLVASVARGEKHIDSSKTQCEKEKVYTGEVENVK